MPESFKKFQKRKVIKMSKNKNIKNIHAIIVTDYETKVEKEYITNLIKVVLNHIKLKIDNSKPIKLNTSILRLNHAEEWSESIEMLFNMKADSKLRKISIKRCGYFTARILNIFDSIEKSLNAVTVLITKIDQHVFAIKVKNLDNKIIFEDRMWLHNDQYDFSTTGLYHENQNNKIEFDCTRISDVTVKLI